MMKKHIFTSLLLLCFCLTLSFAQREETLFRDGLGLTGIWGGPKYNFSYFDEDFAYVRGGTLAFEFGNTLLVGWSGTNFRDEVQVEGVNRDFKLDYHNFMINLAPNSYRAIHPIFGVQVGGGKLKLEDIDESERVFIIQPSAGVEFNVLKWLRLGAKGGYRFVSDIDTSGLESSDVSSPFVQFNLKFGFSWGRNRDWSF